ncbi:hypothetical protein ACWD3Z_42000 [Streptomyces sp. NPDC002740]
MEGAEEAEEGEGVEVAEEVEGVEGVEGAEGVGGGEEAEGTEEAAEGGRRPARSCERRGDPSAGPSADGGTCHRTEPRTGGHRTEPRTGGHDTEPRTGGHRTEPRTGGAEKLLLLVSMAATATGARSDTSAPARP